MVSEVSIQVRLINSYCLESRLAVLADFFKSMNILFDFLPEAESSPLPKKKLNALRIRNH